MQSIWNDFNSPLNEVERKWIRRPITIFLSLVLIPLCTIYGALAGVQEAFKEFIEHFLIDCWYGNKD